MEVANLFRTIMQAGYEVLIVEGASFSAMINRDFGTFSVSLKQESHAGNADLVKKIKSLFLNDDLKGFEEVCLQVIEKDKCCEVTAKIYEDGEKRIQLSYDPHESNLPYFLYEEQVSKDYRTRIVLRLNGKNEFLFFSNTDENFFRTLFHYEEKALLSRFVVYKESKFSYFTPTRLFEEFLALRSGLKVDKETLLENPEKLKDFFQKLSKSYVEFVETLKVNEAFEERIRLNQQVAQLAKTEEATATYDKGVLKIKKEKEGISLSYYNEKDQLAGSWFINEKGKVEKSVSKEVPEKILQAVEEESQVVLPYMANTICKKEAQKQKIGGLKWSP